MRHAFLITVYNNIPNLNRLLELLDDERNLIFLHVDLKAPEKLLEQIYTSRYARRFLVPAIDVRWGDMTQIQCTLRLLGYALKEEWDYCHYITENDMPLKTMDQIDLFFMEHAGEEFVDFSPENYNFAHYKCDVYHLFPQFHAYRKNKLLKVLNHGLAKVQWKLGIRRRAIDYRHGSAYFSISREFVAYVYAHEKQICRDYRFSLGGDEVWLQTICMESPFLQRVKNFEMSMGNLRYIDWDRREGNSPHTFTEEDVEDLLMKVDQSELCFARKFTADSPAAESLFHFLISKRGKNNDSEKG